MISTTLFPGRYIQGYNAIQRLGPEISRLGKMGFLVCSPFVFKNLLPNFKEEIEQVVRVTIGEFGRECTDEEITRLSQLAKITNCEVIVGMGGGKTLDTAKAVACVLKLPVIIVPTIASTDAPCSALSLIYTREGKFKRFFVLPKNPEVVLVDTKILVQAPIRFIVAGMGDALSTWFEAESCKIKHALNMTGDVGSMTAYALAHLCYETLLEYGLIAKKACEVHSAIPAVEHIIEANILLSGVGFESGGVATAHAVHEGLISLEGTYGYLHGEIVAFGTLVSLFLTDKSKSVIDQVYSFCESIGLPTTLDNIGLSNVSDIDIMKVSKSICREGKPIHNELIAVSTEVVFAAIKAADSMGRERVKA
jgi:glycerol dehydrogenase